MKIKHQRLLPIALLLMFLVMANGCALNRSQRSDGGAVGQVIREANKNPSTVANGAANSNQFSATRNYNNGQTLEILGKKLKNNKYDYPVLVNSNVEHWVRYFTGKGRKYFAKYLERGRYFIPVISKVLKTHGMPQDLVYLAMIESGFNNSAKSRAKAVGPWQFMKQTGQRYGLTVDYWLDDRRDTRKSTLAAIAYLKELYEEFGSWELAAAGYNAGENKVRRAIAKYHTNDFWEIAKHRFFRRETRDYVPKIMAAAMLTKNTELFGFEDPFKRSGSANKNPTLLAEEAAPASTTTAANAAAVSAITASTQDEELTPKELGEPVAKSDDTNEDALEKEASEKDALAASAENNSDDEDEDSAAVMSQNPLPTLTPSVYMVSNPREQIVEYEVKGPADLFAVSKASGLPYSTIKLLNPELMRWCTPPYLKTYRVKLPLSVKDRFLATYNDDSFDRKVVFLKYTIKHGDSIQKIAKRYATEVTAIKEINKNDPTAASMRVGSAIALPWPTGYKRVIASMYDEKPSPARSRRRARRARRSSRSHSSAADSTRHYRLKPVVARISQ